MLRVSFFKVSGGSFGEGHEGKFEAVRYPSELHFDTHFEIVTPSGALYGASPVYVHGALKSLDAVNSELRMEGSDTALINSKLEVKGRLTGVHLVLRDSIVGREAMMTDSGFAPDLGVVSDRKGDERLPTQ
jgi:hypothetical protein